MGARSTKLHKGTSSLTLSTRDKYVSTLSLNMYASDWNLVVRDSFKPESVGLPSSAPQTKYIGPPSHLATCDTTSRPESTNLRMKQLCGPASPVPLSSPELSPLVEHADGKSRFTPTSPLSPQSSLDEEKERENEQMIQQRYSYSITSTSANARIEEENAGSFSHALAKTDFSPHDNDDEDSDYMEEDAKPHPETEEKKDEDDEIYVSTNKSLTGSELATLDFLEQALIQEEELDSLVPNMDNPSEEDRSRITYPVTEHDLFSSPTSDANHNGLGSHSYSSVHQEDATIVQLSAAKVNLVNHQEFASSSTDASKTPEAVVSSNSGHFFGNDELSTSIKMNGDASHNGSSSYSAPIPQNIHPMFVPHTPSLPPPAARVEMPQPDYDDPLPNGVLSNGGAVVFDSPDATSSYNGQVAVEASHLKSAKQVAYVKPNVKECLEEGQEVIVGMNSKSNNSPQKKKLAGYSKSPKGGVSAMGQRPVSVAVTSHYNGSSLIEEVQLAPSAQDDIGIDSNVTPLNVKTMVRKFESITPIGIAAGATPPKQQAPTPPRLQSWVR